MGSQLAMQGCTPHAQEDAQLQCTSVFGRVREAVDIGGVRQEVSEGEERTLQLAHPV
jgi:hypothetical protein